jgi:hypothetical protein
MDDFIDATVKAGKKPTPTRELSPRHRSLGLYAGWME